MTDLVSVLAYLLAILVGIWALFLLRRERRVLAAGISIPLIVLGLAGFLRSYGLVSTTLLWTIFGSTMLLLLWFVYESTGREHRTLVIFPIFIGWFCLLIVELYVFFFSPAILLVYLSVALALFHSYDLSKTNVQSRVATLGRFSREIAGPFSAIYSRIRRQGVSVTSRSLFAGFFLFEIILLIFIPIVVMVAFSSDLLFYASNLVMMALVLFVRWQVGYDARPPS